MEHNRLALASGMPRALALGPNSVPYVAQGEPLPLTWRRHGGAGVDNGEILCFSRAAQSRGPGEAQGQGPAVIGRCLAHLGMCVVPTKLAHACKQ